MEGGGGDGGGGGGGGGGDRFLLSSSGWSLLTFRVAKMEPVPTEGDRIPNGGSQSGKRLPIRLDENSCHRQTFSSCGGAWRAVAAMVVAAVVVVEKVRLLSARRISLGGVPVTATGLQCGTKKCLKSGPPMTT